MDHGEAIEAVRHTVAAGDWPDAAQLLADHLFSLTLDGQEGAIAVLLQSFPERASADRLELALAHAAVQLAQGRVEDAAAALVLAEAHVQSAPPARRRRLAVAIASLRLALARRSRQFTEVIAQVNLLDASTADESSDQIAMGSELRGVALMISGSSRPGLGDSTMPSGTSPRARRSPRPSADHTSRSPVERTRSSPPRMSRSRARASGGGRRSPKP
jgi:LuxR family maltose regulon positive regulatory protein